MNKISKQNKVLLNTLGQLLESVRVCLGNMTQVHRYFTSFEIAGYIIMFVCNVRLTFYNAHGFDNT